MTPDLDALRRQIDEADRELTACFERRMEISREIARWKLDRGMAVLDPAREAAVIERAAGRVVSPEIRPYVRPLYEAVMAASRDLQHTLMDQPSGPLEETERYDDNNDGSGVAFLGVPGSFSEEAVLAHFGENCRPIPAASFEEIVEGVAGGRWPMAMLPLENTLTGGVNVNYDLLMRYEVSITAERVLPVRHFLLGLPGVSLERVTRALSHPQALEQCREYLCGRHLETLPCGSTAQAAMAVARQGDPRQAAVASQRAAALYGLQVLSRDIQNTRDNFTRFVLIESRPLASHDADKLSLVCVIDHTPGSLFRLLEVFARRELNLLQLTSRPVAGEPWHYSFYLDLAGNLREAPVREALEEARERCSLLRVLGNYRAWRES